MLLATVFVDAYAFHNASNCTEEFNTILEKAAEIKSHCNMRGFYDCCEVPQSMHTVSEYHVCLACKSTFNSLAIFFCKYRPKQLENLHISTAQQLEYMI